MRTLAILAAASLGAAPAPPADPLATLAWLSGTWVAERGDRWTEERWTPPRGGVMLGTNRSGTGPKATGFEFLRIAVGPDGAITYWGSPGGRPAVAFRLASSRPNEAVFENPAHDYPVRIAYRRSGNSLTAETSGRDGADRMSWHFERR